MKTIILSWRGIEMEIIYHEDWQQYVVIQLEIKAAVPLPITETGYRKSFFHSEIVRKYGGPASFVQLWLNQEAEKLAWQKAEAARKQYSLL